MRGNKLSLLSKNNINNTIFAASTIKHFYYMMENSIKKIKTFFGYFKTSQKSVPSKKFAEKCSITYLTYT